MAPRKRRSVSGLSPDTEEWLASAGPPPDWAADLVGNHSAHESGAAGPAQRPEEPAEPGSGGAGARTVDPADLPSDPAAVLESLAAKISEIEQNPQPEQQPESRKRRTSSTGARTSAARGAASAATGDATPESGAAPAPTAEQDEEQARNIVLRQLAGSPKSRQQLSRKLAEREIPQDIAKRILDRFEELALINDREFAAMWVRSRSQTKRLSAAALKRELVTKGIDPDFIEEALEQVSEDDERQAARELVEKKLRTQRGVDWADRAQRDKVTRRLVSMLARRGYGGGIAFSLVAEAIDEARANGGD
ncbi:recombination regulator RecX [Zhihengliuella somnathii]